MYYKRHKVFISYHHENDQCHRNRFEQLFSDRFDIMVSKSVQIGDIDPNNNAEYVRQKIRDGYIADATVIIVLIGEETWQRKYVDWEIYSGLRDTKNNPRCGLLGIFLPTHPDHGAEGFTPSTIPPRLYDNNFNRDQRYADLYDWTEDPQAMSKWIHQAFEKRDKINPDNSRPMFKQNRSGSQWYD